MHCENIKEHLYDFLTNRLDKEGYQKINEHLTACKGCQESLEELRGTLSLLNVWKAPEVPAGFKARVMEAIEEKEAKKHVTLFDWILGKVLRPYYIKFPLGAVAVAAMILLALTIYRGFMNEFEKPDKIPRDFKITQKIEEAKNPIIVEVEDIDKAYPRFLDIIQSHQGKLIRRKMVEAGMELTFKVDKEKEVIGDLDQLGKVKREQEGYKNGEGNIVVYLKKNPKK
jgi:hypothetical protein